MAFAYCRHCHRLYEPGAGECPYCAEAALDTEEAERPGAVPEAGGDDADPGPTGEALRALAAGRLEPTGDFEPPGRERRGPTGWLERIDAPAVFGALLLGFFFGIWAGMTVAEGARPLPTPPANGPAAPTGQPGTTPAATGSAGPIARIGDLDLVECEFSPTGRAGRITGTVLNRGTRSYPVATVVFRLFNARGVQRGTTYAVSSIEPGATWSFSAPVTDPEVVRYEVGSLAGQ